MKVKEKYITIQRLSQQFISKIGRSLLVLMDRLSYRFYYKYPFGFTPQGSADMYKNLWFEQKDTKYDSIDEYEKESGYSIDKEWFHNLALITQVVIKKRAPCYQHGRLLYLTLCSIIAQNEYSNVNILETGTARGFSALCMAKALADSAQSGKIITFDVLPHDIKMYWNCIADVSGPKTRFELLKNYKALIENYIIFHQGDTKIELKKIHISRVHFAFLDGEHTYKTVFSEFSFIKDKQFLGDAIFFDDYTPKLFPGVVKAIDEICEVYNYRKNIIRIDNQRGYVIAYKM